MSLNRFKFSPVELIIFCLVFGAIGTYLLFKSKAAPLVHTSFVNASSATVSGTISPITPSSGQLTVDFVGSQTVNILAPGEKLTYNQGVKGTIQNICYYMSVLPTKTSSSATVGVVIPYKAESTVNLSYSSSTPNAYQPVCIAPTGMGTSVAYNVANFSPSTGANVAVYQEAINW